LNTTGKARLLPYVDSDKSLLQLAVEEQDVAGEINGPPAEGQCDHIRSKQT
jgi:hypothetical protein